MYRTNHKLPNQRFSMHRYNAKRRGIPFLLSFEEWWKIWQDSGKWDLCGKGTGKYCMSRYADKGAYEIGNVHVCLNNDNAVEQHRNYPMFGNTYGKTSWRGLTPEQRAHRIAVIIKRNKDSLLVTPHGRTQQGRQALLDYYLSDAS